MLLRIIVEGRVGELVEQAQRFALVVPVLAVLERQIGELAPLVGPVPVPALFDDGARDRAGEAVGREGLGAADSRSEEHTSELQSLMRRSYAVFCLKKQQQAHHQITTHTTLHTSSVRYIFYS